MLARLLVCPLVLLVGLAICRPVAGEDSVDELLQQATRASQRGEIAEAVDLLGEVIRKEPKNAVAYYLRGRENFRLGKIKESLADFDRGVELNPASENRQWERGIADYYAGRFQDGAKQFELYQTYHDQDVENSVWRYLCVAQTDGVEKARKTLLPIDNDPRVPMMKILDLYRGKATPEEVLAAARAGNPSPEALNTRLFYTHLYLGLWHEAQGDKKQSRNHILAAEKHRITHYMWDVAHVHAERLRAADAEGKR
jgi:lipoprotein NlpI